MVVRLAVTGVAGADGFWPEEEVLVSM